MPTLTQPAENDRVFKRAAKAKPAPAPIEAPAPAAAPASQATAAPPNPSTGRDAKGRFTAGNPGGPGNPFARQIAQLRSSLIRNFSQTDMDLIAQTLKIKAVSGDLAAAKLVFLYVLGKPADVVNPDTIDIEEYRQIYQPR